MRITEALRILQDAPADAPPYSVTLACGFTPLHLRNFLGAHLQRNLPARRVAVSAGLYGDTAGTLEAIDSNSHAVAVALEWPDLDPRLGYRSAGRWGPEALTGMLESVRSAVDRIVRGLERIPAGIPVAVSLPTLPFPPLFHTPGGQYDRAELEFQGAVLGLAARAAARNGAAVVSPVRLAEESPAADRFDFKSDLLAGLPYSIPHASAVGAALALLLAPPPPKKGLITDLDDTLWSGLAGEAGPDGVNWDLASHSQLHGLYQKLLAALAEEGALVGIASKNDPDVVRRVFERADMLLPSGRVFPIEAHWSAKSGSVERILRTWNVAADAVVFVDDSPMELAEVGAAHPGMECILFPKNDYAAAHSMLRRLRDLFGKPRLSEEDAIRLDSIRRAGAFKDAASDGTAAAEAFLQRAGAVATFDFDAAADDPRILELVNKTNQFNLNGARYTAADWAACMERPDAFLAAVSYQDQFGPLGKIAVIQGREAGGSLRIDAWVMSCRAFSRRIEHQCLRTLFDRFDAREISFEFAPTPRNGPLQDFLTCFMDGRPSAPFTLSRTQFEAACPPLYHRAVEMQPSSSQWMTSQPA